MDDNDVRDLRTKAKELRNMAAGIRDLGARALCLRMAMSYEDLADNHWGRSPRPGDHLAG